MREGPRVVEVPKRRAAAFLAKAEGFLVGARAALAQGEGTSAGALAIHAGISAGDALTIHFLGVRSGGQRHHEVLALLERLPEGAKEDVGRQLRRLLDEKNLVEYDDELLARGDGAEMLRLAERVVARAREGLK